METALCVRSATPATLAGAPARPALGGARRPAALALGAPRRVFARAGAGASPSIGGLGASRPSAARVGRVGGASAAAWRPSGASLRGRVSRIARGPVAPGASASPRGGDDDASLWAFHEELMRGIRARERSDAGGVGGASSARGGGSAAGPKAGGVPPKAAAPAPASRSPPTPTGSPPQSAVPPQLDRRQHYAPPLASQPPVAGRPSPQGQTTGGDASGERGVGPASGHQAPSSWAGAYASSPSRSSPPSPSRSSPPSPSRPSSPSPSPPVPVLPPMSVLERLLSFHPAPHASDPPPPHSAARERLSVVFVSAEVAPWSKTGGLGDVASALPKALASRGHRVMVVAPRYREYGDAWETGSRASVHVWGEEHSVGYFHAYRDGVDWVFVDHPAFLAAADDIHGGGPQAALFRAATLSLAALEAVWAVAPGGAPYGEDGTVFLANDWHAALVPAYLEGRYRPHGRMRGARTALVLHNAAHQGRGPPWMLDPLELNLGNDNQEVANRLRTWALLDDPIGGLHANPLKLGIEASDRIVAVSQGYAWEVTTSEGGWGLDAILRNAQWKLSGIVNGIDVDFWNPANDRWLGGVFEGEGKGHEGEEAGRGEEAGGEGERSRAAASSSPSPSSPSPRILVAPPDVYAEGLDDGTLLQGPIWAAARDAAVRLGALASAKGAHPSSPSGPLGSASSSPSSSVPPPVLAALSSPPSLSDTVSALNASLSAAGKGERAFPLVSYDADSVLAGKAACRAALREELRLPARDPDEPLVAFVGRLDYQKGVDLIAESLPWIVREAGAQVVLLGSGRADLEDSLRALERDNRDACRAWVGFNEALSHRLTAAADILLMPSRFEPCGLNQLYAMRYGAVPVVHAVGGLRDTVQCYSPDEDCGTGWTFDHADGEAMRTALHWALHTYRNYRSAFLRIQRRGMRQDLGWAKAAEAYEGVLIDAKHQGR